MEELPPDPDIDDLPLEVNQHGGPLRIRAIDPVTRETYEQAISRDELGAAFADVRRAHEQ